ncbi:MAG: hypothetical protein ACP5NW_01925 [Candidatus Woesearchaeota archaeon]
MIEFVLTLIVMAVVFIILFWLKKTLFIFGFFFKLVTLAFLVFLIGSILFGYLMVEDANDFRSKFINGTNAFVVKNSVGTDGRFLAGVELRPESEEFNPMPSETLANMEKLYFENNLDIMTQEYYKIFVIDIQSFDEIELYNISDHNIQLTREEIKEVMISDDAREEVAKIIAEKQGADADDIIKDIEFTNEEIKGYLISYYLTTIFNPTNIGGFLEQLKNGNIEVYKETILFKAIKMVPSSFVKILVKF